MKISVIGSTKPNYVASKEEFEDFSGKAAGICYMAHSYEDLANEDVSKTNRRIAMTKGNGHHSVFDHDFINLYLEDIPKIVAMLLNNEKMYTTSEKSARYTKMNLSEDVQRIYDKWLEKFIVLIKDKYQEKCPDYFTDLRIKKLAQENARNFTSVFTPTSMAYSVSYRQFNYLCGFIQSEIDKDIKNDLQERLTPYLVELLEKLKSLPYYDETLSQNNKGRRFSLFNNLTYDVVDYFSDVYQTQYKASFAQLAQAQRHRTIDYNMSLLDNAEFYIPPIIRNDQELVQEWLNDFEIVKDTYPQGMLVKVTEYGTLDNFILKMYERRCTCAQLEINEQVKETFDKYNKALHDNNHQRAKEMEQFSKGARCTFPNFECTAKCMFIDGVLEQRLI
ncbi:MAG: FAD-dependent thymidylate synthase [Clostridia bacterium]|nr:FAD-dependent thymidylate synthase [Clostridia bacterium]